MLVIWMICINFVNRKNILQMTHFEKQRLTEIVLYILNKTRGLDYYHVFKVIYFANVAHLVKYGFPMVSDDFCALPDGPVPSILYNSVKGDPCCDKDLQSMLKESISKGADDAYYMLEAKREADEEYLSKADIEVLDRSISENARLPYGDLRAKSHGEAWRRAYARQGRKIMDIAGMAKDGLASDEMIAYIKENLAVESALS